jgi:hypothetical protein
MVFQPAITVLGSPEIEENLWWVNGVKERGQGMIFDFEIRTEWTAVIPAPDLGGLGFMVATLEGRILEYGFDLQLRMHAI